MARVLHLFGHPGLEFSRTNIALWKAAHGVDQITRIDLYALYPRYDINVHVEQKRLLTHDIIVLQFPLFWYSSPALIKEWIDLVLEHGFAYGHQGDRLKGKTMMLAISAGGPENSYTSGGYQHFGLRTFLTPFEQTARLCQMRFLAPYVFYGALTGQADAHALGFARLLKALRDNTLDLDHAARAEILTHDTLPVIGSGVV